MGLVSFWPTTLTITYGLLHVLVDIYMVGIYPQLPDGHVVLDSSCPLFAREKGCHSQHLKRYTSFNAGVLLLLLFSST